MGRQKIIRTGNSLAVTVPSLFARALGVKAGQEVLVRVEPERGQIICRFSGLKQLSLGNFGKKN